jgi:hypothetical protein
MKNLKYLKYILLHKWFLLRLRKRARVSLWRALMHDLSKLLPSEWINYAEHFYGTRCKPERWNFSWLLHQRRNKHHWEYWLISANKPGFTRPLQMPEKYAREMVLDWMATGRVKTGKNDVHAWYKENKDRMMLHHDTRMFVEDTIAFITYGG